MPAPVYIGRRESGLPDPSRSPMLHPALSTSLSKSFGVNSPFSLSALSSSLTALSSSPGFSSMGMSLGRSFEERPKLEAQFFRNFSCCGLDLQDLHGLLEHFEECHVAFEDDGATDGGMEVEMEMDDGQSEGTISGPPSPRLTQSGPPRGGVYEVKKSALSSFETPPSPATAALHLDPGMELDMELGEPTPSTSGINASVIPATVNGSSLAFQPPPMSAFDNPLPLQGGASKKKFSTAMNAHASMRGLGMGGMGGMLGLDALAAARGQTGYSTPDSSIPGTPVMEEIAGGGVDGIFSVPAGASTSSALGSTVGLAPSLLFPATPADSPESDSGSPNSTHESLPTTAASSSSSSSTKSSLPPTTTGGIVTGTTVNLQEPKDANAAAALAAALGQNSLSALPTALHPLGTGVQISPSGRPYTPPSEKPFKCSVIGCDKSYKQQNGLKYHRLHGHCNQNAVGKEGQESRGEGKPYVCHVTSCGKRYKNMNGLRYHYQHSGAHGALGLQMLAQACHPPPQFPPGHKRAAPHSGVATAAVAAGHHSRSHSPAPSMGSRQASPSGLNFNMNGIGLQGVPVGGAFSSPRGLNMGS